MNPKPAGKVDSTEEDEAGLIEIGRLSVRLIHDLKNQLSGMKLYAAYLKRRFADNAEGGEIADKIIDAINEMTEHTSLIARLTRPIVLNFEIVNFSNLIEMVASSLARQAEAKRVKLALELTNEAPLVSLDAQHIQIALGAIISRAIDSSPAGEEVSISLRKKGQSLDLQIADTGQTPDDLKLRAMFGLVTNERLNQVSLKLALARRIIQRHGGQILARAATPTGTVIELTLSAE